MSSHLWILWWIQFLGFVNKGTATSETQCFLQYMGIIPFEYVLTLGFLDHTEVQFLCLRFLRTVFHMAGMFTYIGAARSYRSSDLVSEVPAYCFPYDWDHLYPQ